MACFSLSWIEQLLIWLVLVIALVAIVQLVLPWLLSLFGQPEGGGMILQILRIVVWALVAIAVITFAFQLLECVFSGPGLGLPRR